MILLFYIGQMVKNGSIFNLKIEVKHINEAKMSSFDFFLSFERTLVITFTQNITTFFHPFFMCLNFIFISREIRKDALCLFEK